MNVLFYGFDCNSSNPFFLSSQRINVGAVGPHPSLVTARLVPNNNFTIASFPSYYPPLKKVGSKLVTIETRFEGCHNSLAVYHYVASLLPRSWRDSARGGGLTT